LEIIEVYNNYSFLGINSRPITEGQEFDMVSEFINFRKDSFKATSQKQLAIFIETKINDAYPDVVFADYNPQFYENWNDHRNKLSTNDGSMSIVGVGPVRLKSVVTFSQGGVIYPAFFLFLKVKDRTLYKNRQNY